MLLLSLVAWQHDGGASAGPGKATEWIAGIGAGDCDAVDPAALLSSGDLLLNDTTPSSEASGAATAAPVYVAESKLDGDLAALVDAPHSVVVVAGSGSEAEILACGEIGGVIVGDQLLSGIRPAHDSQLAGVAQLTKSNNVVRITVLVTDLTEAATETSEQAEAPAEPTDTVPPTVAPPTAVPPTATPDDPCATGEIDCSVEVELCDPMWQDCDGDGRIDLPRCDPDTEDCDRDGLIDNCDPRVDDCHVAMQQTVAFSSRNGLADRNG